MHDMILIVGINAVSCRFTGSNFDVRSSDLSIPERSCADLMGFPISKPGNITTVDLQLDDKYSLYLWGYSTTTGTKTAFHYKRCDYVKNLTCTRHFSWDGDWRDDLAASFADLNPIENLWVLLKAEIHKLRPDFIQMKNNNQTKRILVLRSCGEILIPINLEFVVLSVSVLCLNYALILKLLKESLWLRGTRHSGWWLIKPCWWRSTLGVNLLPILA